MNNNWPKEKSANNKKASDTTPTIEPKTDLKYLFRNFVSIILFCLDEAEKEMKEKTPTDKVGDGKDKSDRK